MTRQETAQILFLIVAVHKNFIPADKAKQDMQVRVWQSLLAKFDYTLVEQATYDNLRNNKFEPTPADIVSSVKKLQRALYPNADEQWRGYEAFLQARYTVQSWEQGYDSNGGYKLKQALWQKLPRPIRDYFGNNYQEALKWQNSTAKDMQIERNRFFKVYDNLLEKYEVLTHIPQKVLEQISNERKELLLGDGVDSDNNDNEEWWQK